MGVSLSRSALVVDMSILMLLLCGICDDGWSLVGLTIVFCGLILAAVVLCLLHRRHRRHHQRRRRCSPCRLLHKGRCARKEIPIFVSLLDRTLVLCVPKDISEAAISDLVRIITGGPFMISEFGEFGRGPVPGSVTNEFLSCSVSAVVLHGTASRCRIKPQTSFEPTFGPSTHPWATLPPPR